MDSIEAAPVTTGRRSPFQANNMSTEKPTRIDDLHFLVAEDDEFQRRWLTVMLAKLGVQHIVDA